MPKLKKSLTLKVSNHLSKTDIMFTKREQQCFEHIIQNENISQVTTNLHITERTLHFYLNNIIKKLQLFNKQIREITHES
jgi:DNA-binding CsgD family transcriptional regulator